MGTIGGRGGGSPGLCNTRAGGREEGISNGHHWWPRGRGYWTESR